MHQDKNRRLAALGAVIAFAAAIVLVYIGGRWIEKKFERPEERGTIEIRENSDHVVERNGNQYRLRPDLTTVLLMGVDKESNEEGQNGFRNGGQADFLRLIVLDHGQHQIAQIQIDRDSMTPIPILGVLGDRSGTRTAQICLAHGFGDGRELSCQLTEEAVSKFLMDIPIDFYFSMDLDGISALNDLLGGIEVTLDDDFSSMDSSMVQGRTLTLNGKQAEIFVRGRRDIGVGTNEARMGRQEIYLSKAMEKIEVRQSQDSDFAGRMYDALSEYSVTDLSRGRLMNEVWMAKDYIRTEPYNPEGNHTIGSDGFMQFHVDEDKLCEMLIRMFYEEV